MVFIVELPRLFIRGTSPQTLRTGWRITKFSAGDNYIHVQRQLWNKSQCYTLKITHTSVTIHKNYNVTIHKNQVKSLKQALTIHKNQAKSLKHLHMN